MSDADPATILENIDLIEGLEVTKKTSLEIQAAQEVAVKTEQEINESREMYRRVSAEGAMLYFLLIKLCVIDSMYQYSLSAFTYFFFKAILSVGTEGNPSTDGHPANTTFGPNRQSGEDQEDKSRILR